MLQKAADFIKDCKGRTVIVYDIDGDGLGAAVILAKSMKKIFGRYPKAIPRDRGLTRVTDKVVDAVKGFDDIIFLDITADQRYEVVLKLDKKSRIMILDHHQISKNLNRYGIVHVNPILFEKKIPASRYCTSKLVLDICRMLTDVDNLDWLAGLGIVNDKAEPSWKSFMKKIYRKYRISPRTFEKLNNIATSSYMFSGKKYYSDSYKACLMSDVPSDILKGKNQYSKKIVVLHNRIEREINSQMKNWKKNAEIFKDKKLIILELKTNFSISSVISTLISLKKQNYTVLVARKYGKHMSISLRRQDRKVDCGLLARKLTKNIKNSSGGGHVPAAGINIMAKDWKQLRKRVLEIL